MTGRFFFALQLRQNLLQQLSGGDMRFLVYTAIIFMAMLFMPIGTALGGGIICVLVCEGMGT